MILVYVAGPFSAPNREGVEENIERAIKLGLEITAESFFPIIPHANTRHPDFEKIQPYTFWVEGYRSVALFCHAMIMCEGWQKSNGTLLERRAMLSVGKPVFDTVDALVKWRDGRLGIDQIQAISGHVCGPDCWHKKGL